MYTWLVLLSFSGAVLNSDETAVNNRKQKVLNVFNIVRFPNDPCNTTSSKSGVCYTESECEALSGTKSGTCASGFGVCCHVTAGCGSTILRNNTYFQSSGGESSPCSVTVCKASDNICQIRLDFDTFNIDQPNAVTLNDNVASSKTQCHSSRFSASSDGGRTQSICGTNTGYHMILEAEDTCNTLSFTWTSSSTLRSWDIRVSQIPCDVDWKPPQGCTQYFTGTTGHVYSYNYQGGVHLANQEYTNCIRQEEGYCKNSYATSSTSFKVSGINTIGESGDSCTTHGDYIIIPRSGPATGPTANNYDRYCGQDLTYSPPTSPTIATVFTRRYPYQIGVYFDATETSPPTAGQEEASLGFDIYYAQSTTC